MKNKLFVSWDGSDPECYQGKSLAECLAKFLGCCGVDDDNVQFVIEDIDSFVTSAFDHDGRLRAKFTTTMGCSAEWCYGYSSFDEAFNDDK